MIRVAELPKNIFDAEKTKLFGNEIIIFRYSFDSFIERIRIPKQDRLIELCNTPCWRYKA